MVNDPDAANGTFRSSVRVLGNGVELPEYGYGTFPLKEELRATVPFAVRHGCRLVESGVFQGLGSIGQDLLNAELHADLWRYDDGKYGELLYRSNNLFKKVKRQVFRVFSCDDVPKKRLREMSRSISDLQELFEKEFGVLQEMILKELPFRKRLYFKAYLKLKHKGIVE